MKKEMTRLIALMLALMLTLGMSALAAETTSDAYRVNGAQARPEETEPTGSETEGEVEPVTGDEMPVVPDVTKEPVEIPAEPIGQKQVCLNSADDSVKIFESADSASAVVGNAFHGDVVDVFAVADGWTFIQMGGTKGWIASGHLREVGTVDTSEPVATPEPTPEPTPVPVPESPIGQKQVSLNNATDSVSLFAEADGASSVVGSLSHGDVVDVYVADGAWTLVEANGVQGWIASAHLKEVGAADPVEPAEPEQPAEPEAPAEPEVPEQPAEPEAPAEPEQKAEESDEGDEAEDEVPSYNIGDEVEVGEDVDVRLEADGLSEIIDTLLKGGKLTVLEVEGDWVKVDIDGQIGYVYIDDLPGLVLPEEPEEEPLPEGELPPVEVTLFTSRRSVMAPGETVYLTSKIENLELYSESMLQWQVDKGDGFEDVPGATEDHYSFEASVETLGYDWQLLVYYR